MRFLIGRNRSADSGAAAAAAMRRPRRGWRRYARQAAFGGAAFATAMAATMAVIALSRSGALAPLGAGTGDRFAAIAASLGFAVADIQVEGRVMTARDAILGAVDARRGTPIFRVDPVAAKAQLEALPWVRSAAVERRLPDTLFVRLVERRPLAIWQNKGKLALIDDQGVAITSEQLGRYPGLLMVVGEDAPPHAAALIDMLQREPMLAARVTAAVRVGGRRWNLRLDNGIDVQLPEENPVEAWTQLARIERTNKLLARNIEAVDLRLPDRLVVRTVPEPPKEAPKKNTRQAARST
jgi:cell division protein FtsQ